MMSEKSFEQASLNGAAVDGKSDDYSLIVADRRVEEASRKVADQIRVVAEAEAAGDSSKDAALVLQALEEELRLATEMRETARLEASRPAAEEREAS